MRFQLRRFLSGSDGGAGGGAWNSSLYSVAGMRDDHFDVAAHKLLDLLKRETASSGIRVNFLKWIHQSSAEKPSGVSFRYL